MYIEGGLTRTRCRHRIAGYVYCTRVCSGYTCGGGFLKLLIIPTALVLYTVIIHALLVSVAVGVVFLLFTSTICEEKIF